MLRRLGTVIFMFNLTSSVPKSWQTVSRQADRVTNEAAASNSTVNSSATHVPPRDLGGVLRERREAMGASLAEVETATRIRQKYLAALESDEWHLLPGEVVGRGFLRNYATYLGLDPTEVIDRRRTVADSLLSAALSGTSAGSALPPERAVDYRPKDVLLKDEPEGIQQRELRVGPAFTIVTLVGVLLLFWWIASNFGGEISAGVSSMLAAAQTRGAEMRGNALTTPTPVALPAVAEPSIPVASAPDTSAAAGAQNGQPPAVSNSSSADQPLSEPPQNASAQNTPAQAPAAVATEAAPVTILIPTDTPTSLPVAPAADESVDLPEPTPTPTDTPPPPTPTETPLPLPTDTPAPPPTDTPVPVVAASCADERMAFFTPGVGQVLRGDVSITGRATDPNLDYYKLEYAVGANAQEGFVYLDSNKGQVEGGILGTLNTGSLPNGDYTLQLTIVDLTGNYPTPCRVSIVISN